MYNIWGTYQGQKRELIDTAADWKEAKFLLKEYRTAYGTGWTITITRHYNKKGDK